METMKLSEEIKMEEVGMQMVFMDVAEKLEVKNADVIGKRGIRQGAV